MNLTGRIASVVELERWLDSGGLDGARSLVLWDGGIDDAGATALAACPDAAGLEALDLSWNRIGDAGAEALAKLPGLRSLRLYHNDLGPEGAAAVARHARALSSLNLCGNALGAAGAASLAAAPGLRRLRRLHLGWVGLGAAGLDALAGGSWPALEELNVRANDLGGGETLLGPAFPALRGLGLDENPIDDDGLAALLAAPGFARLEWLNLGGCELTGRSVDHLGRAGSGALRALRLADNPIDSAARARLASLPSLADCSLRF